MDIVDTTSLRDLLGKWQAIKDLTPSCSTIFVGERQGILRCADELEKVLDAMDKDAPDMDPHNTSGDRPKHTKYMDYSGKFHDAVIK